MKDYIAVIPSFIYSWYVSCGCRNNRVCKRYCACVHEATRNYATCRSQCTMHRGLPPKLPHQLPGEISTGHTDVDTLPRWKDPSHKAQPCGAHQLRTPEGPVDSIGSHKKADDLLIMFSLYWISVTLDSAPFLFQNVFKDKGFIDKLEVAVSCHPKTIILVVYFFLYNNDFEIMDCSSEKTSQVEISIKIRSRKSMKFRNYESFPISKISKQVLFNRIFRT